MGWVGASGRYRGPVRAVRAWDVAAGVTLAVLMPAVSLVARSTQPDVRPVSAFGVALLVVCGLALALGRSWPLLAYSLAVAAAVAYLALRFAGWPVYVGAFAALVVLVSRVEAPRWWVPFAAVGGIGVAVATGRPEGWAPVPMATIAAVWAVAAVLAARAAWLRRRLAEQQAASRATGERLRLARDLHDVLSHSLASISLQAGVGLHLLDRQPEQAREALQRIRQASTDALSEARAALAAVRGGGDDPPMPGLADVDGLLASVRATGLHVELDRAGLDGAPVPRAVATAVYRVVQEALTNVMRHAAAGAGARVRLERHGDWLEIEVVDDGAGAAPDPAGHGAGGDGSGGHGLRGMSERVSALGGQLQAGPASGGGFVVRARLPLGLGPGS